MPRKQKLTQDLNNHHSYLQKISISNLYWRTWNQVEIKEKSKELSKKFVKIAVGYLDDFVIEIHNCLIKSLLGNRIVPREDFKNLPERYEILTKDGVKEIKK